MLANYHMTENKYLESILNNGLIPQQGIRSNLIDDSKMPFFIRMVFVEYSGSIGDFILILIVKLLKWCVANKNMEEK